MQGNGNGGSDKRTAPGKGHGFGVTSGPPRDATPGMETTTQVSREMKRPLPLSLFPPRRGLFNNDLLVHELQNDQHEQDEYKKADKRADRIATRIEVVELRGEAV